MPAQTPAGVPHRSRFLAVWVVVLAVTAGSAALLAIGLTSCVRLSHHAAALRNSLMKSDAAPWERKIEIRAGWFTLRLARVGLAFVNLDSDLRAALGAIRGAEVGVYRLKDGRDPLNRVAMLQAADEAMARQGWERLVGVVNRRELVAAYTPRKARFGRSVEVCVVALEGRELVVASARSDLQPLLSIALNRPDWPRGTFGKSISAAGAEVTRL